MAGGLSFFCHLDSNDDGSLMNTKSMKFLSLVYQQCNFCKKQGHTEDVCRFKMVGQPRETRKEENRKSKKCDFCKKTGHLEEECFSKKTLSTEKRRSGSSNRAPMGLPEYRRSVHNNSILIGNLDHRLGSFDAHDAK